MNDFNAQGLNLGNINQSSFSSYQGKSYGGSSGGGSGISGGVISGLTQVATGLINAKSIRDTANFNSQMTELGKRVARLSAKVEIKNIRKKASSLFSAQQASFAKAGFALTGSPALVMAQSLKESELDVIFTEINADLGISSMETSQRINQMQAKSMQLDEYINTGSSILNTMTKYQGR